MDNYKPAKKYYLGIDNIHVMRDSMNKVVEALKDGDLSARSPNQELLAKSNWLKHVSTVQKGAVLIAQQVHYKFSHVVVHCSDGWDRTPQLTALAQIMLDPYFRTIDGFIVLVEKEWLSFGHRFAERSHVPANCKVKEFTLSQQQEALGYSGNNDLTSEFINGFTNSNSTNTGSATPVASARSNFLNNVTNLLPDGGTSKASKYSGPIFHQFLDCVYQIMRQFPEKFEYNERFLRRLLYHVYSCQYGTFLFNSESERVKAGAEKKTRSVWDYFLARRKQFTNVKYVKSDNNNLDNSNNTESNVVFPDPKDVKWWAEALGRSDQEMNANIPVLSDVSRQSTPVEPEHSQDFLNAFQSMNFHNKYLKDTTERLRASSGHTSTPDLRLERENASPDGMRGKRDTSVQPSPTGNSSFPSEGFGKITRPTADVELAGGLEKGKTKDDADSNALNKESQEAPQEETLKLDSKKSPIASPENSSSFTEPLGSTLVDYSSDDRESTHRHPRPARKFDSMSLDPGPYNEDSGNYNNRPLANGSAVLADGAATLAAVAEDIFGRLTRTDQPRASN
ncbi:phosphatidylinositol-3-phosphatase YMR1 [Sugiyamaella lignohabitans]|uniref:Phosphatidylinositol-3-phosphatase YMR1 n=1 Tax=Sugiyamaella lignohabitans TaxID=796027 RepID=A0A167CIH1_9ASCO|nr:phosphatidylinositol-3-phosphatase YMR1 [Sugiyamaella lignohabitans]ANB11743.1 phosphatidylinositol-3-phosphatase YMR1 [Sugiyamaella lignohabitans]